MPAPESKPDSAWHLDKRVPVALLLAIIAQTATIGIWVGTISSRVTTLEIGADSRDKRIDKGAEVGQQATVALARLEEALKNLKEAQSDGFRRIETTLRREPENR